MVLTALKITFHTQNQNKSITEARTSLIWKILENKWKNVSPLIHLFTIYFLYFFDQSYKKIVEKSNFEKIVLKKVYFKRKTKEILKSI